MKLIGIEEHFLTPEVRKLWEELGLDRSDPSVAVHSGGVERKTRAAGRDANGCFQGNGGVGAVVTALGGINAIFARLGGTAAFGGYR
ncbi:hypothetical protein AAIH70_27085 [Neorhizobium sp. BT27B]|uniref:hypothetical protein n=1 Tax=Neorhizobium sp. BT27B TaxID=3142625 RepID=UPI003D29C8A0